MVIYTFLCYNIEDGVMYFIEYGVNEFALRMKKIYQLSTETHFILSEKGVIWSCIFY